jgi:deazaflavin-dependent oxidoreductase (nitroreductase family)
MSEMHDFNQGVIEEFRANHGVVGGGFAGSPVVLLTTTGAKSGATRVNPLVCLPDTGLPGESGTIYVFASKAGAPSNPDWYYNLKANPIVHVEFGDEAFDATASEVTGDERDRLYAEQVTRFAGFGEYQEKTTRVIPVIALDRLG